MVKVIACTFVGLVRAKTTLTWKPSLPFDQPCLPSFLWTTKRGSSSSHHSGSCACSSPKKCLLSSGPFGSSSAYSFSISLSFSPLHLAALEWSVTARHTQCRPMSRRTWSFIINVALLAMSPHLWPIVQIRLQRNSSTINVLFMLLTCPLTRCDRFFPSSFSAYRTLLRTLFLQLQKCERGYAFPRRDMELVSLSLSLSFTQITCNNEHECCQVITD